MNTPGSIAGTMPLSWPAIWFLVGNRSMPSFSLPNSVCALILVMALSPIKPAQGLGGDDFTPLGGLGCEGDIVDIKNDSKNPGIRIATLEEKGPAKKGGLEIGDCLVSINGKKLSGKGDAILKLTRQVELAEASTDGKLTVGVYRDGKKVSFTLKVDHLGPHSRTCPVKCKKCALVRKRAVKYLLQQQSGTGGWDTKLGGNNGLVVVSTLGGLALKGTRKHRRASTRAIEYVVRMCGAPSPFDNMRSQSGANWSQKNWQLAYTPFLLTSVRQNAKVRTKLKEIARKLIENQESTGGYAHGPGGPNALNYLELEIVSNYAVASLGLIREYGIAIDGAGTQSALDYIKACMSGDGGVAYSTRPGQAGHGDPGRTAGAYFAYYRNGLGKTKQAKKMLKFFKRGMDKLSSGHVSPMMHILAGALAARTSRQGLFKEFWKIYRPYIMSSRMHCGAFAARPTKETRIIRSNTDRTLGLNWTTATFTIVMNLALNEKAYPHLCNAPKKQPKP